MKTSTKIIIAVVLVIILISVGYYFYNKNKKKKAVEVSKVEDTTKELEHTGLKKTPVLSTELPRLIDTKKARS